MMGVRTKQLAATQVGTGGVVLYTCPADETCIVKYVTTHNVAALSNQFVLQILVQGSFRNVLSEAVAAGAVGRWDLWLVLKPGDQLRAVAAVASHWTTVSGTELEGVAD